MPETMSPREKVAAVVLDAAAVYLIQQYGASHGLDHEIDRARIVSAIPHGAILTALASGSGDHSGGVTDMIGSGDHAELARMCERLRDTFIRFNMGYREEPLRNPDGPAAADALEALLAENAALRAQSDFYKRDNDVLMKNAWVFRATEAERKLAEAVGLLRQALGDMDRRVITAETANRIDYFLSKEAERGGE